MAVTEKKPDEHWFREHAETIPRQYLPEAVVAAIRAVLHVKNEDKLSDIWEIIGIYDELAGAPVGSYGGVGMKSEWKVTTNVIDGKKVYGVYRIINTAEVDHSGNREMYGEYMDSRDAAKNIAEVLNEMTEEVK